MVIFQFVRDFLSPEEQAGVNLSNTSGKTNKTFFVIIGCHQVIHVVIQVAAILAILHSILQDMEYNNNVIGGKLQLLEKNEEDLGDMFGHHDVWRRTLCRVSPEQFFFFITSIASVIVYVINLTHFFIYPNFRVRVIWSGFAQCLFLGCQCLLLYYIFVSYFGIQNDVNVVSSRLEVYYDSPLVGQRGSQADPHNSLMVKGHSIYYYCFEGEAPEDIAGRMDDMFICPADNLKLFAVVLSLIDVLLLLGCVLLLIMWHHSAEEIDEYGEAPVHHRPESSSTSSTDDGNELWSDLSSVLSLTELPTSGVIDPLSTAEKTKRHSSVIENRRGSKERRKSSGPEVKIARGIGPKSKSVTELHQTLNL